MLNCLSLGIPSGLNGGLQNLPFIKICLKEYILRKGEAGLSVEQQREAFPPALHREHNAKASEVWKHLNEQNEGEPFTACGRKTLKIIILFKLNIKAKHQLIIISLCK